MFHSLRGSFVCGAIALLAPPLLGQGAMPDRAEPLSVQNCDTRCQSNETDCDLACDQVAACVDDCKKSSEACVQRCRDAPPAPTKPDGSAEPGAPAKPPETDKKPPATTKKTAPIQAKPGAKPGVKPVPPQAAPKT